MKTWRAGLSAFGLITVEKRDEGHVSKRRDAGHSSWFLEVTWFNGKWLRAFQGPESPSGAQWLMVKFDWPVEPAMVTD